MDLFVRMVYLSFYMNISSYSQRLCQGYQSFCLFFFSYHFFPPFNSFAFNRSLKMIWRKKKIIYTFKFWKIYIELKCWCSQKKIDYLYYISDIFLLILYFVKVILRYNGNVNSFLILMSNLWEYNLF